LVGKQIKLQAFLSNSNYAIRDFSITVELNHESNVYSKSGILCTSHNIGRFFSAHRITLKAQLRVAG
jgi:hypothetical protein